MCLLVFLRSRRPPRSTRTATLVPSTMPFRAVGARAGAADLGQARCSGVAIALGEILPVEEGHQRRQRTALLPCPGGDLEARLPGRQRGSARSEEHTSELQSLMRISYADFCL